METKKAFKRDKIQQIVSYCPKTPTGSLFFFGKVRAGKSLAMMSIGQRFHDFRNLKIFDMWGGERNQGENLYWVLPSEFKNYWNYWKKKIRLDEVGQKQYKVSLLYPLFRKLPKEVPKLESYVFPNVFRIPIKLITLLEIKCVIGSLSSSDETLWENITYKLNKSDGSAELTKLFEKEKATNTSLYRNFVYPLIEEGLLCSMDDPDALDVGKEMRDKEVISVLVHHYVPEKFNVFILSWFLFRIWDLSKIGKVPRDIIVLIREASKFFRATDKSVLEDKYKIFKKYLDDFLRYARGKIHLMVDSQSPCLDENTEIFYISKNDLLKKKLKKLDEKFYLPSYNFQKNCFEKKKASKTYIGERDCYEIELEDNTKIIATPNHRFFNSDNLEIFVEDLKVGDEIISVDKRKIKGFLTSESVKKLWKNPEYRKNQVSKHIGYKRSEESISKFSESMKRNWANKSDEEKKKRGRKISKALKGRSWEQSYGKEKSDELRKQMSEKSKGRLFSQETRLKISKANKGNKKLRSSLKKFFREVGISEETRNKLVLSHSGKNNHFFGMKHSKETIKKIKRKVNTPKIKEIQSSYMKNHNPMFNKESRDKMGKSVKEKWKNGKLKENFLKAQAKRPNKKEKILIKIFKEIQINFKYVGDGKVWMTGEDNSRYNPDFINKEKRMIIEFFGEYWHSIKKRTERDKNRLETYQIRGYKVLVVWEKELKDLDSLKTKLIKFYNETP